MTTTVDVAVVGSGCAGLFLVRSLCKEHGRSCAVVDAVPLGQFSSTKNQGWVHSGALYAAKGQEHVARECAEAYRYFRENHGNALHDMRAYYLFDEIGLEEATQLLQPLRDEIRFDVLKDLSAVPEALVREAKFAGAVEIDDRPFDTNKVLTQVLKEARACGALILPFETPATLKFQRRGEYWTISSDAKELIRARTLVLTAGALIPKLGEKITPLFKDQLKVQKIDVLTIGMPLSSSLLATPLGRRTPNVCPYLVDGKRGVTVCLTGDDIEVSEKEQEADFTPSTNIRRRFDKYLTEYMPAILELLYEGEYPASIYVCQKLLWRNSARNDDRRPIVVDFESMTEEAPRCFALYPGKFTSSPIVARDFARKISNDLAERNDIFIDSSPIEISVANQRYLDTDEYRLVSNGQQLIFLAAHRSQLDA